MSITAPGAPPNLPPPQPYRPPRQQQQPQRPPGATGGGTYNAQLHPRGRGGKWIVTKGAGYGAGGPDQTTQQLQQRLEQLGFIVPHDGKYGPQTETAVKAFQTRYGLSTSGGVDAATMALLQNPPPETLAQITAAKKAATKAAAKTRSSTLRKTATAKAKAAAAARTGTTRTSARRTAGGVSGAITRTPGVIPGTSTTVPGIGHLGSGQLTQGAGMTGSSNPAVSNLQAALTQAGIPLTKDGRFGPRTEAAVKRLQTQYGLTADGVVGPATKALLLGLASKTTTTAKAKTGTGAAPLLPGEVATLRTKPPSPRHGSRTAGSRMKLKGPAAKPAILKYSASDLPDPDLEEDTSVGGNGVPNTSTVAFGVGGQPSMSIKDARPAPEPTPAADLPIWDRLQRIANPPDRSIPDGRDVVPQTGVQTGRALIDDGRDQTVDVMALLQEAIAERKAATDGRTFARALARERVLRERLQESLGHSVSKAVRGYFDPYDTLPQPRRSGVPHPFSEVEHPRGRGGKWVDVLAKLKGLKPNKPSEVDGIKAMRLTNGYYTAALPGGRVISESAEHVADAIVSQLEERTFSAAEREKLATKGHAMPHGGFPIENAKDLANAIQALGRAKNPQAAKAHIIAQAKRLKLTASLPDSWNLQESAKTAALAATPSPFSTSKTSNWVARVGGLPSYIQNVAKGIMKSGKSESEAISAAIGICKRWAAGGGGVHPEVKAAAAAAIAEWERKKAQSHAKSAAKK